MLLSAQRRPLAIYIPALADYSICDSNFEVLDGFFCGCDFDRRAVRVAKAPMLVAGDDHTNLHQLNSLAMADATDLMNTANTTAPRLTIEDLTRSKTRKFRGFDIILTNPPFAGEIREPALLKCYEVAQRNRHIERHALFREWSTAAANSLSRQSSRRVAARIAATVGTAHASACRSWCLR